MQARPDRFPTASSGLPAEFPEYHWYPEKHSLQLHHDATFQKELSDDQFYADVRKKYGSRGVAQAKKIKEQTSALFAGGELSEEDQANFIKEMEALFLDAKEEAKKFTPKKYL